MVLADTVDLDVLSVQEQSLVCGKLQRPETDCDLLAVKSLFSSLTV